MAPASFFLFVLFFVFFFFWSTLDATDVRKMSRNSRKIGCKFFFVCLFVYCSFPNNINRNNVGAGNWLFQLELMVNDVFFGYSV